MRLNEHVGPAEAAWAGVHALGPGGAVRGPYRPLGGSSSEERSGRIRFSGKRNEPQKKVWAGLGRLSLTSGSYDNLSTVQKTMRRWVICGH